MSRESALARGRRSAERGMTDTWLITRATTGTTAPNGVVTRTPATIYNGPGRMQQSPAGGNGTENTIAAAEVRTTVLVLQLPVATSGDVQVGDVAQLAASGNDPARVGRTYTITGMPGKTDATARRFAVEEVNG